MERSKGASAFKSSSRLEGFNRLSVDNIGGQTMTEFTGSAALNL